MLLGCCSDLGLSALLDRDAHQIHKSIGQDQLFGLVFSLQWQAISLTVIEKVQIAAIILGSLFLIASISWLIWSSLSPSAKWQRQDLLFQICYGMYGFMDIVCIGENFLLPNFSCFYACPMKIKAKKYQDRFQQICIVIIREIQVS